MGDDKPIAKSEMRCCDCRNPQRMTVLDYFDLGRQRAKRSALPIIGSAAIGPGGVSVRYSIRVEDDTIREIVFEATTCVTLVAYSELLAQIATGQSLRDAICISEEELVDKLKGVPILNRDRAWLATKALRNAIATGVRCTSYQKQGSNS